MSLIKEIWKYLQASVYKVINYDLSLVQLGTSSLSARPVMSLLNPFENKFQATLSRKDMAKTKKHNDKSVTSPQPVEPTEQVKPPVLSRTELLEVSQNISLYYAPGVSIDSNKLVLLSIDPQHLYVYWNLSDKKAGASMPSISDNEMVLRIYSQQKSEGVVQSKPLADFKVQRSQTKQIIRLPISKKTEVYFARLGVSNSNQGFLPWVSSNNTSGLQRNEEFINIDSKSTIINGLKGFENIKGFESVDDGAFNEQLKSNASHYIQTNQSGKGRRVECE